MAGGSHVNVFSTYFLDRIAKIPVGFQNLLKRKIKLYCNLLVSIKVERHVVQLALCPDSM